MIDYPFKALCVLSSRKYIISCYNRTRGGAMNIVIRTSDAGYLMGRLVEICYLCYGHSPTHGNLVELGKAVDIFAGQFVKESGTRLTLRTPRTSGVLTRATANYVEPLSNGILKFNKDLVHLTHTHLYVNVESENNLRNVNIQPKKKVRKHISSKIEGEMHWNAVVDHAPKLIYGYVDLLPKTSHKWT
ncbi:hypothetical protein RJ640_001827 [Escallonia rubra]|uniref:DNA-directed RNA polymerase n=1 Tax=Escallonia rubra TaxID=112253 RepID=A0AA88R1W9_9ASTE|nr:hypothetical protein RJ640_001827 [Escallonia rubra]